MQVIPRSLWSSDNSRVARLRCSLHPILFIFSWTRWPSSAGPTGTRAVLLAWPEPSSATSCSWCSRGRRTRRPPSWSPSSGWRASGGCAVSPACSTPPSSWGGKRQFVRLSGRLHLSSRGFMIRLFEGDTAELFYVLIIERNTVTSVTWSLALLICHH